MMDGCKGQPATVQKLLIVSWPNAADPLLKGPLQEPTVNLAERVCPVGRGNGS